MSEAVRIATARVADLNAAMRVMDAAFDPAYGEAWTAGQLLTLFALPSARICLANCCCSPLTRPFAAAVSQKNSCPTGRIGHRAKAPKTISLKCGPTMTLFIFTGRPVLRSADGALLITAVATV